MLFLDIWSLACLSLLFGLRKAQHHGIVIEWSNTYFLEGELEIARSALLTTLPKMTKEWKVSFDVNPTNFRYSGFASVIHLALEARDLGRVQKWVIGILQYGFIKLEGFSSPPPLTDTLLSANFSKAFRLREHGPRLKSVNGLCRPSICTP